MEDTKILASNSPLPEEIIADILLRLPVKSLLKFRCVSKSWCFLISSRAFAKLHLEASTSTPTLAHKRTVSILPFCSNWFYSFNYSPVGSLFNSDPCDFITFDYPINKVDYRTRVVGCCNGLCCVLVDGKDFVLWNPCTRKYRKLPEVYEKYLWVDIEGFGYDERSQDYKILVVLTMSWFGAFRRVFRLYSLRTNSWKTVDFAGDAPFKGQGVFVSGKLHWVRRDVYRGIGLNINSFDLGTEAVGVVEQPRIADGSGLYPALGVMDGCLCVLCDKTEYGTEVWVMKEYGVKESWTKVMSIPYRGRPVDHSHTTLSLLYVAPDGRVLLKQGSSLFVYHPKKKSFRLLKLKTSTALHGIGLCVESLASPFPGSGCAEQN